MPKGHLYQARCARLFLHGYLDQGENMEDERARPTRRLGRAALAVATLAAWWLAAGAPVYHHY